MDNLNSSNEPVIDGAEISNDTPLSENETVELGTNDQVIEQPAAAAAAPEIEAQKAEVEEEPKMSLADVVSKRMAEKAENGDADETETGEKPVETETETEEKTVEADAKPDEKPVEKPVEKPDELKVEEVDKVHSKDSPTARERIKQLATKRDELNLKVTEYEKTFEVVGGTDGLNEILAKIEILENPEKVDEFVALITNAENSAEIKDKFFWKELDNEANQQLIVADQFGENWTPERLKQVVALVDSGKIDLDNLSTDAPIVKDEEPEAQNQQKTEEPEKKADELVAAETERWNAFSSAFDADLFPVLEELQVLPLPTDAPEIQQAKTESWQKVIDNAQTEYLKNPEFQAIAKMISSGKTDTVTFKNKTRAFKPAYLDIAKRSVLAELPNLRRTISEIVEKQGVNRKSNSIPIQPNQQIQAAGSTEKAVAAPADNAQVLQNAAPTQEKTDLTDSVDRKNAFQNAVFRNRQKQG